MGGGGMMGGGEGLEGSVASVWTGGAGCWVLLVKHGVHALGTSYDVDDQIYEPSSWCYLPGCSLSRAFGLALCLLGQQSAL
jgi:hypothetical protein